MNIQNIGFIGFGLIAGSIAKVLKSVNKNYHITATSRSLTPLYQAQKEQVIDVVCEHVDASFGICDVIFICTPVITITDYLKTLKPIVKNDCIITDVGSVKGLIHKAVQDLDMEANFIGGHPMAGSELSGYEHSSATLLDDAKYVITPTKKTTDEQLQAYIELVKTCRAIPIVMDYEEHDYATAAISHIPHLCAATLANMVADHDSTEGYMHRLAAGGFRDTTRIAASSPEMWEQICSANHEAITDLLTSYIDSLTEVRDHIKDGDYNAIHTLFDKSRKYRNTFHFK